MMDRQSYTVAIICALPLELAAAQAMLDETHPDLLRRQNDNNTYTLGRMGRHNVVIACLPAGIYGTSSAATVANDLRVTFPSVRFGLMVGIAGGVPGKHDVRLGDIVISQPSGTFGGIVQYDFGKTIQNGQFITTGHLGCPPTVLLTAVSKLQAKHKLQDARVEVHMYQAAKRSPKFKENCVRPRDDLLFQTEYDHPVGNSTCEHCDETRLVKRDMRPEQGPVIHYGLIASGNQVMKHARLRDDIGQKFDVLCFEMEAAGLMNSFPCLVVRGICDYADSHKHKSWQLYAATVAAAYARELLDEIPLEEVAQTSRATKTIEHQNDLAMSLYRPRTINLSADVVGPRETWEVQKVANCNWPKLLSRISDYNPEIAHRRLSRNRLAGTCEWFLHRDEVQSWITSPASRSLWCSGNVGCGKTMVFTSLIDHLKSISSQLATELVFFYCESADPKTLSATYLIRSLIKQLLQRLQVLGMPCPDVVASDLEYFFNSNGPEADFEDLTATFSRLSLACPGSIYLIDGLDEAESDGLPSLMSTIHSLINENSEAKVFIASRDELGINIRPNMDLRVCMSSRDTEPDIQRFIASQMNKKSKYERILSQDDTLVARVQQSLAEKSLGMFLWVRLQIEALWMDCICDQQIIAALENLPRDLPATYNRCVARMPLITKEAGMKALRWVSSATRPLNIHELQEAVSFGLIDTSWSSDKLIPPSVLMASCANLVTFDQDDQTIRLAHPSVKDYLFHSVRDHDYPHRSAVFELSSERASLLVGEECINYLSFSNFTHEIQKANASNTLAIMPISRAVAKTFPFPDLATKISALLAPNKTASQIKLPSFESYLPQTSPSEHVEYALLDYARESWAIQTKSITKESKVWNKFTTLALDLNNVWRKHPWGSGTLSYGSRLHGLLVWASRERHIPLLSLAMDVIPHDHIRNICNSPCATDGLPALHIACRLGYLNVVEILLKVCDVNALGPFSRTPLHYAVDKCHEEVVRRLLAVKGIKISAFATTATLPPLDCPETALGLAAYRGSTSIVRQLLEAGAPIAPYQPGRTNPLVAAAYEGHAEVFRLLLERPVKRGFDQIASIALERAILKGYHGIVQLLLDRNPGFVHKYVKNNGASLMIAVQSGDIGTVKLLLRLPDVETDFGEASHDMTPLLWLAMNSKLATENGLAIAKTLLEHGANTELALVGDSTALAYAAKRGDAKLVGVLLKYGAVRWLDNSDRGPLSYAAELGYFEVVQQLMKTLTQVGRKSEWLDLPEQNIPDRHGRIAISYAAANGHQAIVKILLEQYSHSNQQDDLGRTPLSYAAENGHQAIVKILWGELGIRNGRDNKGRTPLSYAAANGHQAIVKILLEEHDIRDDRDSKGRTPLSYAAERGQDRVVAMLARYGIDKADSFGKSPLSYAAIKGQSTTAKWLLDHGANVDMADLVHWTPLSYAALSGHEEMVALLIGSGANLDIMDLSGRTALLFAAEAGRESVVRLLLEQDAKPSRHDDDHRALRYHANASHQWDLVKELLSRGASVSFEDKGGRNPFQYAVTASDGTTVYVPISRGTLYRVSA